MIALNSKWGWLGEAGLPLAMVTAETLQHQLDHVTLPVVRRWRMGKHQQFHVLKKQGFDVAAGP